MELRSVVVLIFLAIALSGCLETTGSKTIPLETALAIVETEVRNTYPVSLSDVNSNRTDALQLAIQSAQCASADPRPLVPVVTGPISIGLQGSFQQQGGATGTISATPSLALAYQVTQGEQQSLTVPITFVSLEGLPDFYLGQYLTNVSNLDNTIKADGQKASEKTIITQEILKRRELLRTVVEKAIADYPAIAANCPPTDKSGNKLPSSVPPTPTVAVNPMFPMDVQRQIDVNQLISKHSQ